MEDEHCLEVVEDIISQQSYGSQPVVAVFVEPIQSEGGKML